MSAEKAILITGTSRGIGHELAQHFLGRGYTVIGVSRSPTAIEHPRFHSVTADLTDERAVASLQPVIDRFPLAGLINNAGIHGPLGPFADNDFAGWRRAFQVNLFAAAELAQRCIPQLRARRGFIIFLSGGGAGFGRPNFSAYGVSKTAVVRLAEVLGLELAPDVRVYCVAPGPNPTRLLEEAVRGGTQVSPEELVDFSYPVRLCDFLAHTTDPIYSGRFIHVRDDYEAWSRRELPAEAYTLRRVKG
ncbi:MAG: SDR family NAD(P)-dependent oxidoreductase [Deltaproteobacteria bacterium]|nr:SDR family NAD(P)-dependent oxidoreductase [Deltaproteobacteria bacterium]